MCSPPCQSPWLPRRRFGRLGWPPAPTGEASDLAAGRTASASAPLSPSLFIRRVGVRVPAAHIGDFFDRLSDYSAAQNSRLDSRRTVHTPKTLAVREIRLVPGRGFGGENRFSPGYFLPSSRFPQSCIHIYILYWRSPENSPTPIIPVADCLPLANMSSSKEALRSLLHGFSAVSSSYTPAAVPGMNGVRGKESPGNLDCRRGRRMVA